MNKTFGVFNRAEEPTKATWGAGGRTGDIAQLIGCDVLDKTGEKIGTLECLWEDETRQPAFLGVRTGWLGFGKIHVVPAYSAERQGYQTLRLPFSPRLTGSPSSSKRLRKSGSW